MKSHGLPGFSPAPSRCHQLVDQSIGVEAFVRRVTREPCWSWWPSKIRPTEERSALRKAHKNRSSSCPYPVGQSTTRGTSAVKTKSTPTPRACKVEVVTIYLWRFFFPVSEVMESLNAAGERVNLLNTSTDTTSYFIAHFNHERHQRQQSNQVNNQTRGERHRSRPVEHSSTKSSESTASISTVSSTPFIASHARSPPSRTSSYRGATGEASFSSFPSPFFESTPQLSRQHSTSSPLSSPSSLSPPTPAASMPTHHFAFDPADSAKGIPSNSNETFYRPPDAYYLPSQSQQPHSTSQFPLRPDMLIDEATYQPFVPASATTYGYATDLIDPITPQSATSLSLPPTTPTDSASTILKGEQFFQHLERHRH